MERRVVMCQKKKITHGRSIYHLCGCQLGWAPRTNGQRFYLHIILLTFSCREKCLMGDSKGGRMPLGSGIVQVGHGQLSFGGRSLQERLHQQARTGGWAGEGYNLKVYSPVALFACETHSFPNSATSWRPGIKHPGYTGRGGSDLNYHFYSHWF